MVSGIYHNELIKIITEDETVPHLGSVCPGYFHGVTARFRICLIMHRSYIPSYLVSSHILLLNTGQ